MGENGIKLIRSRIQMILLKELETYRTESKDFIREEYEE